MPRYFFDLEDGRLIPDVTGLDLSDGAAAQDHAVELAETILRKRLQEGGIHPWHVIIKDDAGELLGTVTSISVEARPH